MFVHATRRRRRWGDDQSSSGGPGGAPTQPGPVAAEPVALSVETARAVMDFYLRGGAANFVVVHSQRPSEIRTMREAGLIETQLDARGKDRVMLTARGLSVLAQAASIANAPRANAAV